MPSLLDLKRSALQSCEFRGHTMGAWQRHDYWPKTATSICEKCGASVTCQVKPPPNGIDIGGDAVAINCR